MPDPSILFCADEHLAIRAPGDYADLCPDGQMAASGTDGAISATAPWVLASASVSFAAQGVMPGMVVRLDSGENVPAPYGPDGEILAIGSVSGNAITLRRIGFKLSGQGQPPATTTLAGIGFAILTFTPQIEDATYDLDRKFAIDDNLSWRSAASLYDARELRQACVLTVLVRQYTSEARGETGDWAAKAKQCRADLDATLERLTVQRGWHGQGGATTSMTRARIIR